MVRGDGFAALLACRAPASVCSPSAVRARSWCRETRSRCAPSRRSRRARGWPGMRAEMSPPASRFMTSARPFSGRVMLRPISQLNPRPSSTCAMPTTMIMLRVRSCDAVSAAAAARGLRWPRAMISSAGGIIFWPSMIDHRDGGRPVGHVDPVGEGVGVGLHLLAPAAPSRRGVPSIFSRFS